MIASALSIAGSDPSGGAGLQADLKVFHQFGVFGAAIASLCTVQNDETVSSVVPTDASVLTLQLEALERGRIPQAVKTGALGSVEVIERIGAIVGRWNVPLVVDPIVASTSGWRFLDDECVAALKRQLLPHAHLVMPNLDEASLLSGIIISSRAEMSRAAEIIAAFGPRHVLIKGGHLPGPESADLLFSRGREVWFLRQRITREGSPVDVRGTGCALSAAITALLARGSELESAVETSKDWITRAIEGAARLGTGRAVLDFFAPV